MHELTDAQRAKDWKKYTERMEKLLADELLILRRQGIVTPELLGQWLKKLNETLPAKLGFPGVSGKFH